MSDEDTNEEDDEESLSLGDIIVQELGSPDWEAELDLEAYTDAHGATVDDEGNIGGSLTLGFSLGVPDEVVPELISHREDSIVIEIPDPEQNPEDWEDIGIPLHEAEEYYNGVEYVTGFMWTDTLRLIGELCAAAQQFDDEGDEERMIEFLEQLLVKGEDYEDVEINLIE